MANDRVFLTLSRGISRDLAEPFLVREIDAELAENDPELLSALRDALHASLYRRGVVGLDGEIVEGSDGGVTATD